MKSASRRFSGFFGRETTRPIVEVVCYKAGNISRDKSPSIRESTLFLILGRIFNSSIVRIYSLDWVGRVSVSMRRKGQRVTNILVGNLSNRWTKKTKPVYHRRNIGQISVCDQIFFYLKIKSRRCRVYETGTLCSLVYLINEVKSERKWKELKISGK